MPKVGGRRKKARSQNQESAVEEDNVPKAFVFKRGRCNETCKDLALDFRKCFYPNTAMKLEDSNKLAIKSYLKAAKYYSVTHLVAFQQSKQKTYAKFIKVGGGEMIFRVLNYCRMKDVFKRSGQSFNFSLNEPLIVLNNFAENNQVRQIGRSIQEMFPSINLQKINLKTVKRVLSFTYQPNKKCIYFRHYRIIINEGGINNSFKELTKQVHSDMSKFKSFAEFLDNVKQQQNGDFKETQENQREVKLVEIGPRMKLKFLNFKQNFGKIQDSEDEPGEIEQKIAKIKQKNKNKKSSPIQEQEQEGEGAGEGDQMDIEQIEEE